MWERGGRGGGAGCFIVKKLNILGGGGDAGAGGMGGGGLVSSLKKMNILVGGEGMWKGGLFHR